jgi:hypothetical protein
MWSACRPVTRSNLEHPVPWPDANERIELAIRHEGQGQVENHTFGTRPFRIRVGGRVEEPPDANPGRKDARAGDQLPLHRFPRPDESSGTIVVSMNTTVKLFR